MISKEIKEFREGLGLSQEGFGKFVGVSYYTVYKWEHGRQKPTPNHVARLDRLMKEYRDSDPSGNHPRRKYVKWSEYEKRKGLKDRVTRLGKN